MFSKIWEFLKGKKVYLLTFVGAGLWGAHLTGIVDDTTWKFLTGIDIFGIIAAFRAAMASAK